MPEKEYIEQNESQAEKKIIVKGLKGVVAWYSVRDCYGFIKRADGEQDVFVHQMAISKSYIRKPRYRSLAEGEEVQFDLAEGRKGRYEAANVTGPDGKNVIGTSILIRFGSRYGPHVVGLEEDMGYGSYQRQRSRFNNRFRRDRNNRRREDRKQDDDKKEGTEKAETKSEKISYVGDKDKTPADKDATVMEMEGAQGNRNGRPRPSRRLNNRNRFRRNNRRRFPSGDNESHKNPENTTTQKSIKPQSNEKASETLASEQKLSSSATTEKENEPPATVQPESVAKRIAQWNSNSKANGDINDAGNGTAEDNKNETAAKEAKA